MKKIGLLLQMLVCVPPCFFYELERTLPDVLIALQRSTMLIALQCSRQKAGWGWKRGALNEIPRRECDRRRHSGDMTPTNFLQCHHCQHRAHHHHQCHTEDERGNHAQQVHFRLISQSRHSGPLGPISLQWQKCQLTLLFSRQPDSNRELRKQAPR